MRGDEVEQLLAEREAAVRAEAERLEAEAASVAERLAGCRGELERLVLARQVLAGVVPAHQVRAERGDERLLQDGQDAAAVDDAGAGLPRTGRAQQRFAALAMALLRPAAFGSGLVDAHDMTGLLHMLSLVAEGRPFTVRALLESMRAQGVQAGNGHGLIGETAVLGMVGRFIEAGFVRRLPRTKAATGRFLHQAYEVYLDPALNPDRVPGQASPAGGRPASVDVAEVCNAAAALLEELAGGRPARPTTPPPGNC
jgi:hypothetical protein